MKKIGSPEITEEKSGGNLEPGTYLFQQDEGKPIIKKIATTYPEIYQNGYKEKNPNPGGGESIFFG